MVTLIEAVLQAQTGEAARDPSFPHAPEGWTREAGAARAGQEQLTPTDEHWDVVRALQEYYARHAGSPIQLRDLHDALDERFHDRGGIRYLYQILPGGPVAQGCRIAGLAPPAGAVDTSFGSVA
jgi:tRNA 2-thiouridine synthesizing protein E